VSTPALRTTGLSTSSPLQTQHNCPRLWRSISDTAYYLDAMYFNLQPPAPPRRSSSWQGHYPLTPPTCSPASVNKNASSAVSELQPHGKRDSASSMLSRMASGCTTPTRVATEIGQDKSEGENERAAEGWSEKSNDCWQRKSDYVSFPDFEGYHRSCDNKPEGIGT
jgi:hypothetical protein